MNDPKTVYRLRQAPPPPIPISRPAMQNSTLGAPIAHFDEGFSSDGAFLSGAETEKEATPTDHESEGAKTPMYELPRGERTPFPAKHAVLSQDDDEPVVGVDSGLDHVVYSHSEEELLKSIVSPPKEADEARTSLLMQQESFDTDFDECSQSESYKTASESQFISSVTSSTYSKNHPTTISCVSDLDTNENQLKREFEIQATSRPRCTTPVSSCVIESFIAASHQDEEERQKLEKEKLKISIPGATAVDEPLGKLKPTGRRSSKSWSEFYENMAVSASGRISGRTTPLSGEMSDDAQDMFDKNPAYQHKVPPSPVVHRRSSTDWVNFDAHDDDGGDVISVETANDLRFTQSHPQPDNLWNDNGSSVNVPAAAAAISASIAAMSYDDYHPEPGYQTDNEQNQHEQVDTNEHYSMNWNETVNPDIAHAPLQSDTKNETYNYSYEPPTSYLDSVLDDTNYVEPNSIYDSETGFSNYPPAMDAYPAHYPPVADAYPLAMDHYDHPAEAYPPSSDHYPSSSDHYPTSTDEYPDSADAYVQPEELYPHPATPYSPSVDPYQAPATNEVYQMEDNNYPYYSDYSEPNMEPAITGYPVEVEPATQSFSSYPSVWDEDASVNPVQSASFTAYDVSNTTANLSTWDEKMNTSNISPMDKSANYTETPVTSSPAPAAWDQPWETRGPLAASSWDDDASEVPRQSYQSKPPWAYQDYPEEKAKPLPTRPPPPVPVQKKEEIVPSVPEPEVGKSLIHSFIREKPKPVESEKPPPEVRESSEWLEYEKMTAKIAAAMKQTQDKLQEINKTSIAQEVSSQAGYIVRPASPVKPLPPQNLMDMDLIDTAPPAPEPTDSKSEWKPIHERLNEEIQKQKELNKPRRPPPPKGAPKRPPPPSAAKSAAGQKDYATSWDDEETLPPPPPAISTVPTDYSSAWDNDSGSYAAAPIQSQSTSYNTTPMVTQSSETYDANDIMIPSYSSKIDNIDRSNVFVGGNIDDFGFSGLNGMDESSNSVLLPPPPLDIYQTQSASPLSVEDDLPPPPPPIMPQENLGDEDIFDVSKYSSNAMGKPAESAAVDLDDFFGGSTEKKTPVIAAPANLDFEQTYSTQSFVKAPIPPPRSPLVERQQPQVQQKGKWEDTFDTALPVSDSGFFQKISASQNKANNDPFAPQSNHQKVDLFSTLEDESLMQDSYDPFDVKPIDVIVAEAKSKTQAVAAAQEMEEDLDFFGQMNHKNMDESSTPRVPSPTLGFGDEFLPDERDDENRTPSPLYDEDDSQPLQDYPAAYTGDGWELMLRYPAKKKIMGERYWKSVFVQISGNTIQLYYSRNDKRPFQELPLQSNYCMSDITLQAYDVYGKIHTVKVQYVLYKERVGVRPGQIPKLVEGKLTKLGLPLEHAAQTTVLLKFGSLNHNDMQSFVYCVEDVLFKIPSARERPCLYKQDEIQVHCYDEYSSYVNKDGAVSDQRARVRIFCLAFVSGMPYVEIGLNDRRRQGKEVVRRKDIMPMFTERWIRFEALEFHSSVEKVAYDKEHVIKMRPLDATFFEVLRFRVRPPRGKELPLQVRAIMKLAGSKIEIRLEVMVASFKSRKARQVPCEDIQIRFPIPEAWIYLFREERHWGYGSVHAKVRRPGKVKNIKDRLMGMVQHTETSLIEAAIGDAKYEHVYRSLVWRIPRLPEKHHGAYKTHLLRCRFELNSFDLMPESFIPNCEVEYTMPVATVSHTVIRSVSIEQNEDPDKVEKWVRYLAKYQYKVEVDYVQTNDLDIDAILDNTVLDPEKSLEKVPVAHKPSIDTDVSKEAHAGYRIEFAPGEFGDDSKQKLKNDSSSDSDDDIHKAPVININMKGYGY